jgi:hypothetical protein
MQERFQAKALPQDVWRDNASRQENVKTKDENLWF